MKNPALWTKYELHKNLQHAINVELWTIPLYLTALYSIRGLNERNPSEYPEAAKLVQSVAVQEMLHLEIVCNISNALGHTPVFLPPQYHDSGNIPFIHPLQSALPPHLHGYQTLPGALNESTLKFFCTIELPHVKKEIDWDKQKDYHSISDLYEALKTGITHLWDECYIGDVYNTKQKKAFGEYHNTEGRHHGFSQIVNTKENALRAIEAIVEQGEGADSKNVPADFRPPRPEEGKEFNISWFKGELSHYHKFSILLHHHKHLPEVYATTGTDDTSKENEELNITYKKFIQELNICFSSDGDGMSKDFWNYMFELRTCIQAVWQKNTCPVFND